MTKPCAIVLAGGFGTRLGDITKSTPKPLVDVAGRPFLEFVLDALIEQGVEQAIFSLSFLKEQFIEHFGKQYKSLHIQYAIEDDPLGTGGGISNAIRCDKLKHQHYLVVNGDTSVEFDLAKMLSIHTRQHAHLTMLTRYMDDTDRYGRVETHENMLTGFAEKQSGASGSINSGIYLIDNAQCKLDEIDGVYSFEKDYLEKYVGQGNFSFAQADGYFIDIGIPADLARAKRDFA
ncbi:sugar phosphate nucleotidyltransferase [Glaciecola sp. 2405UD65-10]|uniref:sugar phosphate nucleotidyltransferase n=1 Tax=Glaciecola sp. 2405UD65-10 TaxID=3397244 RepID=UPI003B5CCF7F